MTSYTVSRAQAYPRLADVANGEWRQHLGLQDRVKIRLYLSAMLERCLMSRYYLTLGDLKVRKFSKFVEKDIFESADNETDYFAKLLFRLSRLIGLKDMVEVVPVNFPVRELLIFPELNFTPIPYGFLHGEIVQLRRDEKFLHVLEWITSLDQEGHPLLKRKEIDILKEDIYAMDYELDRPLSRVRLELLSERFSEIRKLQCCLQNIDEMLGLTPSGDDRFRLEEFLKAWLLKKAIEQGRPIPFRVGTGAVHHCFYDEIVSIADVWVDYKLRAWPVPGDLALARAPAEHPLPQQYIALYENHVWQQQDNGAAE